MIRVLTGNMLESHAQTLVNTVNCVGVMGKGIALQFKKKFPEMYKDYVARCERKEVELGKPYLYKSLVLPWVLNFPTKDHWRSVARLDDIIRGLEYLLQHYKEWGITSLAVPPLGCGQGQLEWRVVGPTLYNYLNRLDIPIELYAPHGTPHEELKIEFLSEQTWQERRMPSARWVKSGWVALVEVLKRVQEEPYHWPIGRVAFQKIAYVVTKERIPTGLQFKRHSFGPFSPEFTSLVLSRLINNGLIREEKRGSLLAVKVGGTFEDARKAYIEDLKRWEPRIARIADLFMRVNGSHQSELVATVMFVADELVDAKKENPAEDDVVREVMTWKLRHRPPLKEEEIRSTVRDLAALGWVDVKLKSEPCENFS
jgi:O-acetyl-ADP-ribose deacetylase (regulator of RNase III)/uncharacterized protein YwgA